MTQLSRRAVVVLGSVALHGLLGGVVAYLAPPAVTHRETRIAVEIRRAQPAPVTLAPTPAPPPPQPVAEAVRRPPDRALPQLPRAVRPSVPEMPSQRPPNEQDQQHPNPDSTPPVAAEGPDKKDKQDKPSGPINLFAGRALETAVGGSPDAVTVPRWGGTTRRAGDGLPAPGTRDATADREEAASRVRNMIADITGRERAASGNLPPAWRDAERGIDAAFAPPAALVTDDNAGKGFLKQWMARGTPQSGTTPRGVDPSADLANQRYDQMMVGQQSGPPVWLRTEIEVVTNEAGEVLSAKVTLPSGRSKLDKMALEAVRSAIGRRPVLDPRGRMVSRWAVSASVSVAGPTALGLTFDESAGKVGGVHPMKKEVKTRVALLSLRPVE